jgi:hypothetical protein
MSRRFIEGAYARLRGIKEASFTINPFLPRDIGNDYQSILEQLREKVDDEFVGFDLTDSCFFNREADETTFQEKPLNSKINQLIKYLETVHNASTKIVEIGSVYNLIRDAELKSR